MMLITLQYAAYDGLNYAKMPPEVGVWHFGRHGRGILCFYFRNSICKRFRKILPL